MSAALVATGVSVAWSGHAFTDVKIGVTVSATGPAASLGIPEKNTIGLLPKEIGGKTVQYIILDDASDTGKAMQNTRKLIDEDHVDAIIGSTVTPNALAMLARDQRQDAGDLAGGIRSDHPADGREARMGLQTASERQPDGRRDRRLQGNVTA